MIGRAELTKMVIAAAAEFEAATGLAPNTVYLGFNEWKSAGLSADVRTFAGYEAIYVNRRRHLSVGIALNEYVNSH